MTSKSSSGVFHTDPAAEFPTEEHCHIIEIFNQQQAACSIARSRVEPGVTTANHLLHGTAEWYYILQGQGEMMLNNSQAGTVGPGDVVHIPAGTPQCIRNTGQEDLIFLCICTPGFSSDAYEAV